MANRLSELKDSHLECRSYHGHAFTSVGFFYWKSTKGKGICKVSKCSRCSTYREDYLFPDGSKMDSRYHYPDSYLMEAKDRPTTKDIRKEMLRRVEVIHASPDDLPVPGRVKLGGPARVNDSNRPRTNPKKISSKGVVKVAGVR